LLHPRLTDGGLEVIEDAGGAVKLLYVVPITARERHIVVEHGPEAFTEYVDERGLDLLADRTDTA
jgi:hypothetical protein